MSVDRRMRADLYELARGIDPDTWSALEEVRQRAGHRRARHNALAAVAAVLLLLIGSAAVPAVGDWWREAARVASDSPGGPTPAEDPEVEALLDDLTAATNAGDTQAVLDLFTDDATYFGQPVTPDPVGGIAPRIRRSSDLGIGRVAVPALVVNDGFDYAIAYRGTVASSEALYLARARALDEGLKIYELTALHGPITAQGGGSGEQVAAVPAVEALLDALTAATDAGDAEAVLDLLTDDAIYFGQPVASTPVAGLSASIRRTGGLGLERVNLPALVVTDGFDYAIAYRGTIAAAEMLYLARARTVDGGLQIYEISKLKGR